jgi:hypothetical protein
MSDFGSQSGADLDRDRILISTGHQRSTRSLPMANDHDVRQFAKEPDAAWREAWLN